MRIPAVATALQRVVAKRQSAAVQQPAGSTLELIARCRNVKSAKAQKVRAEVSTLDENHKALVAQSPVDIVDQEIESTGWQRTSALWLFQCLPSSTEVMALVIDRANLLHARQPGDGFQKR